MVQNDCVPQGLVFDVGIDGVAAAAGHAVNTGVANDFSPAARSALLEAAKEAGLKMYYDFQEEVTRHFNFGTLGSRYLLPRRLAPNICSPTRMAHAAHASLIRCTARTKIASCTSQTRSVRQREQNGCRSCENLKVKKLCARMRIAKPCPS